MPNGNSGRKLRDGRTTEGKDEKGGRTVSTAAPALFCFTNSRIWCKILLEIIIKGGSTMDSIYVEPLVEVGTSLTTLAVKGTATAINSRIKAIRDEKNAERIRATYDEIVNELISEREEAVRIAQIYKNEIERIAISDDDIQHLHRTVEKLLELLKVMSPNAPIETFEQIKELISVDTLKAIQLLGFNYKAAIGEPLTQLCANAILSKAKGTNSGAQGKRK